MMPTIRILRLHEEYKHDANHKMMPTISMMPTIRILRLHDMGHGTSEACDKEADEILYDLLQLKAYITQRFKIAATISCPTL